MLVSLPPLQLVPVTRMEFCFCCGTVGDQQEEKRRKKRREDRRWLEGVLDLAATDLAEQRRRAPPSGAKPKGSGHGLSLPLVLSTCWDLRSPGGGGRCLRAGNSLSRTLLGQAFHEGLIQIMVPERGKGIPCF